MSRHLVITVPVRRPKTRLPIPPKRRHRDRKNDHQRNPKHRNKEST